MAGETRIAAVRSRALRTRLPPSTAFAAGALCRLFATALLIALGLVLTSATPTCAQATTWNGAVSNDWFVAGNWTAGVPVAAIDARIYAGTAVVESPGAVANWVSVGNGGTGTLIIQNGGTVSSTNGYVGANPASRGTVMVDGVGSTWTNSGVMVIGIGDPGTLTIRNGGAVSAGTINVGQNTGSTGTVTVDGTGSTWDVSGTLTLAYSGTGALTIQNGGAVSNVHGYVGHLSGSTGAATVDGIGSTWTNSGELRVGNLGTGTLTIQNGGAVSNTFGYVGANPASRGTVMVDGVGSTWTNSSLIVIGIGGTGTLTIRNGGTVSTGAGQVSIGSGTGSAGTLNIGAASGQAAAAPGRLNATSVVFGAGTGNIVFNHSATNYAFAPAISGAGSVRVEAGTTILTGTNTYSGGTTIAGGTLQLGSGGTSGGIAGGVTNNGSLIFNRSNAMTLSGPISGAGVVDQVGTGTTILTGTNTYTGGTTISGGALQLGSGGTTGSITGGVTNNGSLAFNRSDAMSFGGPISGVGAINQIGTGTTILTGTNTYTGGTTISGGTLQLGDGGTTGSITGGVTNNGTLAFNRSDAMSFSGPISGVGTVRQIGSGITILTGANSYTGPTTVDGGTLAIAAGGTVASATTVNNGSTFVVNGRSGAVTVNTGGTLGGSGTVGPATINGGLLSPGNSIGTITVAGNLMLSAASAYLVEIDPAGQADRTNVTGSASLAGTVQVIAASGSYLPYRTYTILNAAGGISGSFSGASSNFAFLSPSLTYDANNVFLMLEQSASIASAGQTPNQLATAAVVQSLGLFNPVYGAVVTLATVDQARQALHALSGEVHASTTGVLIEDARYVRSAVLGRLRQAPFDRGAGSMASLAAGGPAMAQGQPASTLTFWAQGFGAQGTFDGNVNAAAADRRLGGAVVGLDGRFGDDWRLGFAAGFSESKINVDARASSAAVDSGHIAVYGGKSFGALNLRAGAAYAHHQIGTTRLIAFPGLFDRATADYDGGSAQVFGEIGYGFALGSVAVEPFAGLAWVRATTTGFTETGGPAALTGAGSTEEAGYSTFGARFATTFALANGMALAPRLSAAWQHAFDDVTPTVALAFASGGGFGIAGVPIAQDSALLEAGFDLRIGPSASLGFSYLGHFAGTVEDHAVNGKFVWNF